MQNVIQLAYEDEVTALRVLAMPFLDTYENPDSASLGFLLALQETDPDSVDALLSDPALAGGITEQNKGDLRTIAFRNRERQPVPDDVSRPASDNGISPLPAWILSPRDSWENAASEIIGDLWLLNPEIGGFFAHLPWVADGITVEEYHSLSKVRETVTGSAGLSDLLQNFWSTRGYSERLLHYIHAIALIDVDAAKRLLDQAWTTDGITNSEFQLLSRLTSESPIDVDMLNEILTFPWLADGVSGMEAEGARYIIEIWRADRDLAQLVLSHARNDSC